MVNCRGSKADFVQYVSWAGETDPDSFFTSDKVKGLYKEHVKAMTGHVNGLTNVAYKDDPTIMAWGMQNPRQNVLIIHPKS